MTPAGRPPLAVVAAVLALALALRVWALDYGLPWLFYFHDEPQVVLRALRFGTGDLNPHFFIWPGTLLLYLAFLSYGAMFVIGRIAGAWTGAAGFAAAYFRDPTWFYLLPRLHSVAFGVWGVWLTLSIGRAAGSTAAGVAAAVGLAVNALHAHYSHFAHPVTAMTTFTLLGLWAAIRGAQDGARRHFVIAGLALGLGVACQYHAALLAVPIGVAALLASRERGARALWLGTGAIGLGVAVFLVLCPYTLLDARTFLADLRWITAKTEAGEGGQRGSGPLALWTMCLVPGFGVPLVVAAGAGIVRGLLRRTRADLVLLSFIVVYLLLLSRAGTLNDRYAIPLAAPALVLLGLGLEELLARLRMSAGRRGATVAATVLLLALPNALELVETNWTMSREDTRVAALRWVSANVPADERVVIDMLRFWNTASPPMAENRERLLERVAEIERGVSGAGHSSAYLDYYRFKLANPSSPAWYLRSTELGGRVTTPDSLRAQGFRWAVVSDEAVRLQRAHAEAGLAHGLRYYDGLEREAREVARFAPERWRRRGPEIRIYRLDEPPAPLGRR